MTENQKLREALRFTKKPVTIEATQWFKHGDHAAVTSIPADHPIDRNCIDPSVFGWVPTLEGGHVVTPGDWIITGVKGEHYPCKPDIFAATYVPADEQALALPTAAPVGDLPELPELPEPAAWRTPDEWPMCYQYTHEEPDAERIQWAARYGRKHEQVFTADQMRAYARAALSAGDAVDGGSE